MNEDNTIKKERLPSKWVLVVYGVKAEDRQLSTKLRWIVKKYGLWSIDRGGSVYVGPSNPDMDSELMKTVEELKDRYGDLSETFHMFEGEYNEQTTEMFFNKMVENISSDLDLLENSIMEIVKAINGEMVIKRYGINEVNLLTTGILRINNAKRIINSVRNVIERFQKEQVEMDTIKTKLDQLSQKLKEVESVYKDWAKVEKAKIKAKDTNQ